MFSFGVFDVVIWGLGCTTGLCLVLGIGANIFKLAGTVILYGVVAVYIFGLLRLIIIGG